MRTEKGARGGLTASTIVLTIALAACGGSQSTPAENNETQASTKATTPLTPVLAKAHLMDAASAAKKWKSDAVLTQVSGSAVPDDGKIAVWQYVAWSPSARTCLGIRFYRGTPATDESGGEMCETPPLNDIIDSDQVITIARANGVTKQQVSMGAMASATRPEQSVWSVIEEGMRNPGNITLDIDGATGKVLGTTRNP